MMERRLLVAVRQKATNQIRDTDIIQQHSSNDFMKYFTSKIETIRAKIVTMQLSDTLSHQIVRYRSPEEQ